MNHDYLKKISYNWEEDPRNLKVHGTRPAGRCYKCGRKMLNALFIDTYCRDCHSAMSISRDGPDHDFDYFMNGKQQLDRRETLEPVPFELEDKLIASSKDNFKLANGKPVPVEEEEDERIKRLYDLR